MADGKKVTARDILALLKEKYADRFRYACASEVPSKTGFGDRRFDFVAVNCWQSDGLKIEVFEIKISKSDLKHELEHPEKHNWAFSEIDAYWLVAPAEIIDMDILPKKWGVMSVKDGKLNVLRKPIPLHDDAQHYDVIKRDFAIAILRSMNNASLQKALLDRELRDAKDEAYNRGKEDGLKESSAYNATEYQWMKRFFHRLNVFTEQDAEKLYKEIDDLRWLSFNMEFMHNGIETLKGRIADLDKAYKEWQEKRKTAITPLAN